MFKKKNELTYRKLLEGVNMGTMVHGEKTLMARFSWKKGVPFPITTTRTSRSVCYSPGAWFSRLMERS